MRRRAVFLNRDGVINRYLYNPNGAAEPPSSPAEFEIIAGAGEAIAALNRLGLPAIAVSNQPGIAHGALAPPVLDAINEAMRACLAWDNARLDAVLYCRHHPEALLPEYRSDCSCRMPRPGLLLRAAHERNINLAASFLIGAGAPEILAGLTAGVTTILVSPHHSTTRDELNACGAAPHTLVRDLEHAVSFIRDELGPFWHRPRPVITFPARTGPPRS
ncbi:MAG: HAD-IIIA family hydrolase [Candidatus Acidiferrales bacterium]|jgi:D-glycero-D-manno-heptose 1,7-bisphosphate phosphatase